MDGLPEIVVLGVGGTIAMTGEGGSRVLPRLDTAALVAAVPGLDVVARIRARTFSTVPSPHLALADVVMLARAVAAELAGGADAVVVTHGTDTLEESAWALELMLAPARPVVFTGAMRNAALPGADGPANLLGAVQVAASPLAGGLGVVAVMNDEIHRAASVRKAHTSNVAAFRSPGGPLGHVSEGRVHLHAGPRALERAPLGTDLDPPPVALLEACLGEDGRMLDTLPGLGYRGLVVAGMGAGHVHPAMVARLTALAADMPVVLASRCGEGAVLTQTYAYAGGEIDLLARGLINAGILSPVKARITLALLLGAARPSDAIREFFQ